MLRSDLDAWLEKRMGKVPASDSLHAKIIATVEVPSDYDPKKQALLEKALEKLRVQLAPSTPISTTGGRRTGATCSRST